MILFKSSASSYPLFCTLLLLLTGAFSPAIAETVVWPQRMVSFFQEVRSCSTWNDQVRMQRRKARQGPVLAAYTAFVEAESCRVLKFKAAFEKDPSRFCPGVCLTTFPHCYSKILDALTDAGLGMVGYTTLQNIAIMYTVRNKGKFASANETQMQLVQTALITLTAYEKRLGVEALAKRLSLLTPRNRPEVSELRRMEDELSAKYAKELLGHVEKALNRLERPSTAGRRPASDQFRESLINARILFLRFAKRWNYVPAVRAGS